MKRISPKRTALEFQFVSSVVQNRLKANLGKVKLHRSTRAKRNTRRRRSVQVEIQFSCKWLGGNRQHISLEIDNYMHIFTSHMFASNAVSLLAVETFYRCCSTLILRRFCYCINELFRIFLIFELLHKPSGNYSWNIVAIRQPTRDKNEFFIIWCRNLLLFFLSEIENNKRKIVKLCYQNELLCKHSLKPACTIMQK